jgi:hypothetical protein
MAWTNCLFGLVSSVRSHHKNQALLAGTRQNRQAGKAAGPGCFVVAATRACSLKRIFSQLIHLYQSTFLRYLWWVHSATDVATKSNAHVCKLTKVLAVYSFYVYGDMTHLHLYLYPLRA